jgi:hypothetical protein
LGRSRSGLRPGFETVGIEEEGCVRKIFENCVFLPIVCLTEAAEKLMNELLSHFDAYRV